jgi:hypothetical protein
MAKVLEESKGTGGNLPETKDFHAHPSSTAAHRGPNRRPS